VSVFDNIRIQQDACMWTFSQRQVVTINGNLAIIYHNTEVNSTVKKILWNV